MSPQETYRARLDQADALSGRLERRDVRLSRVRILTFVAGAGLVVLWWQGLAPLWTAAAAAALFVALVLRHDRILRARSAARQTAAFYERGLARIEDRWIGTGATGERFRDDRHLYANDLDIFGEGSLFELLSIARTRAGEETLASWLTRPASPADVRSRQQAVTELAPALDLRESVARAGAEVGPVVDGEALVRWSESAAALRPQWLRAVAACLTAAAVAAAAYAAITAEYGPLFGVLAAEVLFSIPQRSRISRVLHAADGPARDLDVLAHVLDTVERQTFSAPLLGELRQGLETTGVPASRAIRRLHRLVELHDWQHNQFFAPIGAALLWGTHLAWAIEAWRRRHGTHVRAWLRTVGTFEALASLSAFRFEHPDDVWPELVTGPAQFSARALGHPLIPAARLVRNDVALDGALRLLVVSGSNMSGKSTLLRTVGINAVLALAGAPVHASALRLTPVALGATLRIQDSLQQGRSRFYAEITRIRELADAARGPLPLLFLLDELLQGTNSHDRLVGAAGILRSLVDRGAIGLITTHDLALTAIAGELAPRAANVHFEDRFDEGAMSFDYRLKPGAVTRSNAVALMRAVGLEVEGVAASADSARRGGGLAGGIEERRPDDGGGGEVA